MKTEHEKNIIYFIKLSSAIAILDLRACPSSERGKLKDAAQENGSILMCLRYTEFRDAVRDTIFDVMVPTIPREITLLLSSSEEKLEESLESISQIFDCPIDYKLIRD